MTSPCHGCIKRNPRCHGNCPDYADWKKDLAENHPVPFPMTEAHEQKIKNDLRQTVKNRADGRGKHNKGY